jgi:hypothetical protein
LAARLRTQRAAAVEVLAHWYRPDDADAAGILAERLGVA